eukprot:SAG11_NODE_1249_length_5393_cov_4.349641_8_plen_55_part_00
MIDRQKCQVLCETALGIEYLHGQNVLHKDIKPGNILLAADGECSPGGLNVIFFF